MYMSDAVYDQEHKSSVSMNMPLFLVCVYVMFVEALILTPPPLPLSGKRGVLKRPWSEAERTAVESHLTRNIAELRVPAKADCERCLQLCPLLVSNRRDWRAIKFYCHNRIQLLKKTRQREGNSSDPLPIC